MCGTPHRMNRPIWKLAMKCFCVLVLPAVLILGGCDHNEYDIELTPAGDGLERKLMVTTQSSADPPHPVPDDETARVAKEYSVEPPAPAKTQNFRGRFTGRMPNDVGGFGRFARWETSFGSAALYAERFRGNDDAAGELKRRQIAADRLVDLFIGWLAGEMKNEACWPALRRFIHEEFRRDLNNLGIHAWTIGLSPRTNELPEPVLRAAHCLVERGYFAYEEIPTIRRMLDGTSAENDKRLLAWFKQMILARLPADAPPPSLELLETPERLSRSLDAYLESTEEYAQLWHDWKLKVGTEPNASKPEAVEVARNLAAQLFAGALQLGGDQISVALKTGRPALYSNGQWSPESEKMQWAKQPLPVAEMPSAFIYAVWDEPNEVAQKARFGAVALRGKNLYEYCTWYHGLTAAERTEWDKFVQGLRPGPDLVAKLREFRFQHEPVDGDGNQRHANSIVEMIVGELKDSE